MALLAKKLPANAGDLKEVGLIPGSGRSPGGSTYSSILAWRIPRTEGYSPWGHKESNTTEVT